MSSHGLTALHPHLASHHGVVSRAQAVVLGMSVRQVEHAVRVGELQPLHRGVYVLGDVLPSAKTRLLGACLAAGPAAVASHRSAAWAWNLVRRTPPWPVITVPADHHPQLHGVEVHRSADLDLSAVVWRKGIPITAPARTLVDLAGVVAARLLDGAVDVAIAERLVDVKRIEAELDRLGRHGRRGVKALRASLVRRGLVEPPAPSVLESKLLRLLWSWGIVPLSVETKVAGGRYRIDVLLAERLALEVDGFAYHSSPEAKAADSRRRNALRALGFIVVESDWVTVTRRPEQLHREILTALALAEAH